MSFDGRIEPYVEPPPDTSKNNHQLPDWCLPMITRHFSYKVIYGGRGSSKSWTIAACLLYLIAKSKRPMTVVVMREYDKDLDASAKACVVGMIQLMFGGQGWEIFNRTIRYPANGSIIRFRGINKETAAGIRSLEGADIWWHEEAQFMSREVAEQLYPTVRARGAELWLSFNPLYRTDPVWRDFCSDTRRFQRAWVMKVNFDSNPWESEEAKQQRLDFQRDYPERYAHLYLGEPDDEGEARKVLPYANLLACVEAVDKWLPQSGFRVTGRKHAGLDIADAGADRNALTIRTGPMVQSVRQWAGRRRMPSGSRDPDDDENAIIQSLFTQTAEIANEECIRQVVHRLYYDVGGIGGPFKSILLGVRRRHGGQRAYRMRGENFGGEVRGKDVVFVRGERNEDHFDRRNAQLGWAVHMRMMRTLRLLDGEKVNPERCLFIDRSGIRDLELYLGQMSQPEWEETPSGKIKIIKRPPITEGSSSKHPSPDMYDSTVLSFSFDSRGGLKARAA